MTSKKRTKEEILKDIEERKARIKDLQEKGDEACSEYDLSMGYDANFYLNVCTLPANHIKYYEKELAEYNKDNIQLDLF